MATSAPGAEGFSDSCYLSAQHRALSTAFSSVVGSVLLPLIYGPTIAFFVGWNCYFGVIRICLVSAAGLFVSFFGPHYGIRQPFIAVNVPPISKDDSPVPMTSGTSTGGSENTNEDNGNLNDQVAIGISLAGSSASTPSPRRGPHGHREHTTPHRHREHTTPHGHRKHTTPHGHRKHTTPHGHRKHTTPHDHRVSVFPLLSMSDDHHDESHDKNNPEDIEGHLQVEDAPEGSSRFGLDVFSHITKRNKNVGILGALGLVYSLIYTPMIQVLWLRANWKLATPPLFFARALSVTIVALPYTIDTHARYGLVLGKMFGSKKLVPRLVNVYMALANAVLSLIVVSLYVRGVEVSRLSSSHAVLSLPFFTVIFFSLLAPLKSLIKLRPADKGYWGISMKAFWTCGACGGDCTVHKGLYALIVLVAMVFLGFIAAGPSISISASERVAGWLQEDNRSSNTVNSGFTSEDLMDLESWFHCSSISWWKKAVQILP